jgi:capsular exopolysaccharide synthesis family protein
MHLRDYWRSVRKHLWLVIGLTVLITTLAAIYMARKQDTYQAGARVQVDLESNNPILGSQKSGSFVFNNPINDPAYFNTQLQILSGPSLLRRVAKTLDLEHNQGFLGSQQGAKPSLWQGLVRMVGLGSKEINKSTQSDEVPLTTSTSTVSREDLAEAKRLAPYVKALLLGIRVEPVKETRLTFRETRLIDISFDHNDPQLAAKVVNTLADSFVLSNLEKKTETGSTAGDYLQKRIAELQAKIRNGEEQLINYAKSHQILSLDASQNTVVERLVGLNKQLLEAENDRELAESAYRAAKAPGATDAIAEDTSNARKFIDEANLKLAELEQKREQLLVDNTEEWPEVKEVDRQIASIKGKVKEASSRASAVVITNLETKYRQAKSREDSLRRSFEQQRGETLTQNEAAISYRIIQQEIDTNKGLLEGLLQRSKENDVILAGTPNNIRVVDYAIAPTEAIGPRRLLSVGMAFMLSLAFGVGLALFLEYLDDTIRNAEDVENILRLPALALIPTVGGLKKHRRLLPAAGGLPGRNGDGNAQTELLIDTDARSPLAESYRQLRTSLLLSTAGRPPQTLLVTSSVPSEGKTTTSVNTAISLAQTGANVLIIDADMRRPRLHSTFEVENRQGLSSILSSEMSEAEVLSTIQHHEASGLHLLTSGPIPPNPAELIGSEQMRRLITTLQGTFKHIVIDSPPINSFTDGVLIASMVDGVLLVVHGGRTSRSLVRRSRQLLQDVGARIFGIVLNNVELQRHDYYYYQRYYHQSYYDKGTDADELTSST